MKYWAIIVKVETGEVQAHEFHAGADPYDDATIFSWQENNYSCDCNRELMFERARGNEIDDGECSEGRFYVPCIISEAGVPFGIDDCAVGE